MNSETLDSTRDIGRDGDTTASNLNRKFAKDVFGYSLHYFSDDYSPIGGTNSNNFLASKNNFTNLATDAPGLYNGNINYMVTTITNPTTGKALPQLTAYKYDQLNRLKQSKAFDSINFATNAWVGTNYTGKYFNSFTFDAMGNITSQVRADANGKIINNLTYQRLKDANGHLLQNRLYHVNDTVASNRFADDIDDQGVFDDTAATVNLHNNYAYDEIGNLKRNTQKEIEEITWTVYGKVKEVFRTTGSSKKNLKFDYDAMGNRSAKHVYSSDGTWEKSEYYLRDATGNLMSIYKFDIDSTQHAHFAQTEREIYGSSLVAVDKTNIELISPVPPQENIFTHTLGNKHFQATNHLSSVLTTFSDMKIAVDANNDGKIDFFKPSIFSASDYSAFGVVLSKRSFNSLSERFAFNGKEKDDEIDGEGRSLDFGARIYDADLGRFLSCDPVMNKFPHYSPYLFAGNSPIMNVDFDGKFKIEVTKEAQEAGVTAQTISNFETVVANMQKMVEANPAILKKMSEQTGLSETELKGWMTYGEGPTITIGVGITAQGASGNLSGINIEASLVNSIDNTKSTDANYESTLFSTGMLVLHEATHVGDAQTNGDVTTGTEGDMGKQNTKSKFGHRGMDTDNTILGMSVSVTGSSQTDKWSFTKSDLYKAKEKLSPSYGGGFFSKMYNKVVNSFKNDKPQESKVKYQ